MTFTREEFREIVKEELGGVGNVFDDCDDDEDEMESLLDIADRMFDKVTARMIDT